MNDLAFIYIPGDDSVSRPPIILPTPSDNRSEQKVAQSSAHLKPEKLNEVEFMFIFAMILVLIGSIVVLIWVMITNGFGNGLQSYPDTLPNKKEIKKIIDSKKNRKFDF